MNDIERRPGIGAFELRAAATGKAKHIAGYAAKFGTLSQDMGGWRETILPGAFDRCIKTSDVRCLINHDPSLVLGRVSSGTLGLTPTKAGLYFTCILPDTQYAKDLHASVQRGDITQCSFAFTVAADGQSFEDGTDPETGQPIAIRVLRNISNLQDVSAVTYPAYEDTVVQARAIPSDMPAEFRSRIEAARSNTERRRDLLRIALS